MSRVKRIAIALPSFWKTTQSAFLAQGLKFTFSSGEDLMSICLMAYIPNQLVIWKIQYIMQCQCKFYHSKIGCQMSSCPADGFNQKASYFFCQLRKFSQRNFLFYPESFVSFFHFLRPTSSFTRVNRNSFFLFSPSSKVTASSDSFFTCCDAFSIPISVT